jgi:hypothetical protein
MLFFRKKPKRIKKLSEETRSGLQPQSGQRVISYYTASRQQLDNFDRNINKSKEDSLKERSSIKGKKRAVYIIIAIILLASVFYLSLLSSQPNVDIKGPEYRKRIAYHKIVEDILKKDFKNRSKILLRTNYIKSELLKAIPEAKEISIKLSILGRRPEVEITNYEPMIVFEQPNNSESYILSNRGRLLLPAKDTSLNLQGVPIINNQSGVKGKAGDQFLNPEDANNLSNLLYQYKVEGIIPDINLVIVPHEILVTEPGRGYRIKYLLSEDTKMQFGALRATQKKMLEMGINPAEYIDVRLADKVYYK